VTIPTLSRAVIYQFISSSEIGLGIGLAARVLHVHEIRCAEFSPSFVSAWSPARAYGLSLTFCHCVPCRRLFKKRVEVHFNGILSSLLLSYRLISAGFGNSHSLRATTSCENLSCFLVYLVIRLVQPFPR
jgi:hypothetical protein